MALGESMKMLDGADLIGPDVEPEVLRQVLPRHVGGPPPRAGLAGDDGFDVLESFGTGRIPDADIQRLIERHFDLRPASIIAALDLRRPIYAQTAAYGHFGRSEPEFTWESTARAEELARAARSL